MAEGRPGAFLAGLVLLMGAAAGALGGQALSYTKENYPDPRVDKAECGQGRVSWVCDPGDYMTRGEVEVLEANINGFGGQTPSSTIMVAIVPQIIGSNGKVTTSSEDLKEFTNYLHQKKWRSHAGKLMLVVYHTSRNAVWVQSDFPQVTAQCICQLTYESQQFFTPTGFPTLLDIYTKKFRDVIAGHGSCSTPTDNVPWKILVTGMTPLAGDPNGRTQVQLHGQNFDLAVQTVFIGTQQCKVTFKSATLVKFTTPPLRDKQKLNVPQPVYLLIGTIRLDTGRRFVYATPMLNSIHPTTTTVRGGLLLTVEGKHLDLVNTASMLTMLTGKLTNRHIEYTTACEVKNEAYMYCPTPELELERVRPSSRPRRDLRRTTVILENRQHSGRVARAAGNTAPSQEIDDVTVSVRIKVNDKVLPLDDLATPVLPVNVFSNPVLYPFDGHDSVLTFVSVWPRNERHIDIGGTGLLPVLKDHTISVHIGDSVCTTKNLYVNRLVCDPPIYEPRSNGTFPFVQASVGYLQFKIGYLEYQDTFWKYPPTKYTILGLGGALFFIFIIFVSCCCRKKPRKQRKTQPMTEGMKQANLQQRRQPDAHQKRRK